MDLVAENLGFLYIYDIFILQVAHNDLIII